MGPPELESGHGPNPDTLAIKPQGFSFNIHLKDNSLAALKQEAMGYPPPPAMPWSPMQTLTTAGPAQWAG